VDRSDSLSAVTQPPRVPLVCCAGTQMRVARWGGAINLLCAFTPSLADSIDRRFSRRALTPDLSATLNVGAGGKLQLRSRNEDDFKIRYSAISH